jgi:isopropylmalate/homocitrate/citramalate synthase
VQEVTDHKGPAILVGKKSGKKYIKAFLDKLKFSEDTEQLTMILRLVKQKAYELKRVLNDEEFRAIHKKVTKKERKGGRSPQKAYLVRV